MQTILIQAHNAGEMKLIESFLKQHSIKNRVLTNDDKEDIVLGRMMEETNYDEVIDTTSFLSKLRS